MQHIKNHIKSFLFATSKTQPIDYAHLEKIYTKIQKKFCQKTPTQNAPLNSNFVQYLQSGRWPTPVQY